MGAEGLRRVRGHPSQIRGLLYRAVFHSLLAPGPGAVSLIPTCKSCHERVFYPSLVPLAIQCKAPVNFKSSMFFHSPFPSISLVDLLADLYVCLRHKDLPLTFDNHSVYVIAFSGFLLLIRFQPNTVLCRAVKQYESSIIIVTNVRRSAH